LQYRFQDTTYRIAVENPDHRSRGVILVELDGVSVTDKVVKLRNDGLIHQVRVVLGKKLPP
jgi:cyclic beta-1,2-glucan synthetase